YVEGDINQRTRDGEPRIVISQPTRFSILRSRFFIVFFITRNPYEASVAYGSDRTRLFSFRRAGGGKTADDYRRSVSLSTHQRSANQSGRQAGRLRRGDRGPGRKPHGVHTLAWLAGRRQAAAIDQHPEKRQASALESRRQKNS